MNSKKNSITINIGKDFSRFPAGRYITDGVNSAERFKKDLLLLAFKNYEFVTVIIDTAEAYGASFLEEAFATDLIEIYGKEEVKRRLELFYEQPAFYFYKQLIERMIDRYPKNTFDMEETDE